MDSMETLADVVAWAVREGLRISAVVVQDEYSHDVVVSGAPDGRATVFETT
jgi:hypothetical protein